MAATFVRKIYKHFENITDPRVARETNHDLIEIIFVTLCAVICDANSWVDVERFATAKRTWLRKYVRLANGVPSHDTLGRIFARLDSLQFYASLQAWVADLGHSLRGESIAIDGKTLRGSFDRAAGKSALHTVTAFAGGLRLCLGCMAVDDKSNEIPAVQALIDMLDLEGAVVTTDAMHCQRETVEALHNKKAEYLLTVKANQRKLLESIQELMLAAVDDEELRSKLRRVSKTENNRGREEFRECAVMACPKDHPEFAKWAGVQTIGVNHRVRMEDGKTSEESEYFISSLAPRVRDIAKRLRGHWSIENGQHYILDVTFTEDSSRIRKGTAPEISSAFRRFALNILQRDTSIKDNIRGKRKTCGWDDNAFSLLIQQF